mgnify:CR=1 FL=1
MKYIKIQAEVMEALEKNKSVYLAILKDDNIAVSYDNYVLYKIPRLKFYLDFTRLKSKTEADNLFNILTESAWKTDELKKRDNKTLIKIANQNGHAWINEKLLKYFDKDCKFEIAIDRPEISPVKIIENDICVGIVMPYISKN